MINRRKQKNNTSGYRGVYWHRGRGKWIARIKKDGVHHEVGGFASPAEAARARDIAARKVFGEFATTNAAYI